MKQSQRLLTATERSAVAAQRDALMGSYESGDARRLLEAGKGCRDSSWHGCPRMTWHNRADGDPVPIVEDVLLADLRSPRDRIRMDGVARSCGLTHTGMLSGLDGIHMYVAVAPSVSKFAAAIAAARRCGIRATPDHVMALAGRIKWTDLSDSAGPGPVAHAGPTGGTWSIPTADVSHRGQTRTAGDDAPLVVVVDTGVRAAGRTDGVLDGVTGDVVDGDVIDLDPAHGTFVAGVVRQVAPHARVHVVRAFGRDGVASDSSVATKVLEARDVIAAHGGRGVINLSWGCETFDERPPLAMARALSSIEDDDIAIVAAAGNDGRSRSWFPARLPGVVSVGALALDADELRGSVWSNCGDAIDVSTVGEGVVSTFVAGRIRALGDAVGRGDRWGAPNPYAAWSGTSFAAPQIAGRVAEMLVTNPDEPASVVIKLLADDPSARDIEGFGVALRIL